MLGGKRLKAAVLGRSWFEAATGAVVVTVKRSVV
ncbi:MAG: hypothetical protein M2R46_04668 [Verrucomicrobia subdivision 3 bacterium]|nr:hypothetical protein [Limisphaerales bacterium]